MKMSDTEMRDMAGMNNDGTAHAMRSMENRRMSMGPHMKMTTLRELKPGSLIISHDFRMGDWTPEKSIRVPWKNLYRTVYVWTVPRGGRYKKS